MKKMFNELEDDKKKIIIGAIFFVMIIFMIFGPTVSNNDEKYNKSKI